MTLENNKRRKQQRDTVRIKNWLIIHIKWQASRDLAVSRQYMR
jgi:hypothetical protein